MRLFITFLLWVIGLILFAFVLPTGLGQRVVIAITITFVMVWSFVMLLILSGLANIEEKRKREARSKGPEDIAFVDVNQ